MLPYKKLALAVSISSLLTTPAAYAAAVSYNSQPNGLEANGRVTDGSGIYPFVAGNDYASAGNPTYTGNLPATWYAQLNGIDAATLSAADVNTNLVSFGDANGNIGVLQVGGASYQNAVLPSGNKTAVTLTNWGHNADFGLLQLNAAANLTITVAADTSLGSKLSPGFSVWQGWDTSSSSTRHQPWLQNGAPLLSPGAPDPFGSTGLNVFEGTAWTAVSGGSATLTLTNLAAGDYTIVIGGYQGLSSDGKTDIAGLGGSSAPYAISFTTSAVPLPSSLWLFATAFGGWLRYQYRNARS